MTQALKVCPKGEQTINCSTHSGLYASVKQEISLFEGQVALRGVIHHLTLRFMLNLLLKCSSCKGATHGFWNHLCVQDVIGVYYTVVQTLLLRLVWYHCPDVLSSCSWRKKKGDGKEITERLLVRGRTHSNRSNTHLRHDQDNTCHTYVAALSDWLTRASLRPQLWLHYDLCRVCDLVRKSNRDDTYLSNLE